MASTLAPPIDLTTLNAITHSMSLNNEAVHEYFTDNSNLSKFVASLSVILRICRQIISVHAGSQNEPSSIGEANHALVAELLDDLYRKSSSDLSICQEIIILSKTRRRKVLEACSSTTHKTPQIFCDPVGQSSTDHDHDTTTAQSSMEGVYICDKPILFPPSSVLDSKSFVQEYNIRNVCMCLIGVATFNLALVHQLAARDLFLSDAYAQGKQNGEGSLALQSAMLLLRKAARLYQSCITSVLTGDGTGGNDVNRCLLHLTTLNNLGAAFEQLNQQEEMDECFRFALKTLMFLVDRCHHYPQRLRASLTGSSSSSSRHRGFLPVDELDGILLNVSRILSHCSIVALAA